MSIGGISGSGVSSLSDRFQQFQSGQANLQKKDLTELKDKLSSAGHPAAEDVDTVLQKFDRIDTNRDGMSVDELDAWSENQGSEESARQSRPSRSITINISPIVLDGAQPPAAGGAGAAQGSSGMSDLESLLQSLDTNKDGQISLEELMSALKGPGEKAESGSGSSEKPDLKKLLENAFAAAEENPGKAAGPASAGIDAGNASKNIGKYTAFSSTSVSIRQSSLSVQFA